jgi:hypothetical protein
MRTPAATPSELIAIASMIFGFGIVVIMFRVQRELSMRERPNNRFFHWTPWADWLILASVPLVGCLTIVSLLAFPGVRTGEALAAAACGSAVVLQIGYIPAIFAHYRMFFGKQRFMANAPRKRGEPAEKVSFFLTVFIATLVFVLIFWQQHHYRIGK